ncbi:hypothetical protein ACYZT2_02470 [Pseudomonas sp. MDT1-85]
MQTTSPYSTIIVLELSATASLAIRDQTITVLKSTLETPTPTADFPQRIVKRSLSPHTVTLGGHEFLSSGFVIEESRLATWNIGPIQTLDIINVLVCASFYRDYLCIHLSDGEVRTIIEREIRTNPTNFPMLKASPFVNPRILEIAFLQDAQIKALWPAGGHKRTSVKANAKLLNGDSLEYALDPLADQTFIARSARAQTQGASSYGITPRRSAIWRGPNSNFSEYQNEILTIISKIDAGKAVYASSGYKPAIPMLMNALESFAGVTNAFDFDIAEEESMDTKSSKSTIREINNLYIFEPQTPSNTDQKFDLKISLSRDNTKTITINVTPKFTQLSNSIIFDYTPTNTLRAFNKAVNALTQNPEIWKCWYESYHTIAAAQLCSIKRRNSTFDKWIWFDFLKHSEFDVTKEKPDTFSDIWSKPKDNSLFTWCIKSASGQLSNTNAFNIPGLPLLSSAGKTWLYCDDNSREIADFVYLHHDGKKSILALIHVKGAKNSSQNRKPVPTPYEVVVAQAIKNVIDMDNERLLNRIERRASNSNHKIWNNCWNSTTPTGTSARFIAELKKITSKTELLIVIIQPHVLANNYYTKNPPKKEITGIGPEQLRTLLHGLQISAMGVNADLYVVADGVKP